MIASEMTFGVEIECYIPAGLIANGTVVVGGYHRGVQVPALPAGWTAQHDGSLHSRRWSRRGVEFVSPVLKGAEGLAQVKAVVEQLKAWGATVNETCGFHVHIGFPADKADVLGRLVAIVSNHETAIYAATGTKSRERGSYCRSVRQGFNPAEAGRPLGEWQSNGRHDRYHLLNVKRLADGGGTVEFRAFAGTLNFAKVAGYIRLALGMVEKAWATKRQPKWTPKAVSPTSPIARKGGVGQTELTRLYYALGWTAGRVDRVYGEIVGPGLPTTYGLKRQLLKLAAKYDQRP